MTENDPVPGDELTDRQLLALPRPCIIAALRCIREKSVA